MSRRKRVHAGPGVPCPRCKVTSARFVHPQGFVPPTDRGWYSYYVGDEEADDSAMAWEQRDGRAWMAKGDDPLDLMERISERYGQAVKETAP